MLLCLGSGSMAKNPAIPFRPDDGLTRGPPGGKIIVYC